MIIIQCDAFIDSQSMTRLRGELRKQAEKGLILLPYYCRLAAVTGKDEEIVFYHREECDERENVACR